MRDILTKHAGDFAVAKNTADHYCLVASTGPATVKAWRGKMRSPKIPVAWVQVAKTYVSYHLMGVYGNPKLLDNVSKELHSRMQGKSCFNFMAVDEELFEELEHLTVASIKCMKKAGFIAKGLTVIP